VAGGLLEAHGLSVNGYEALQALSRKPGGFMRRIDLARSLGLTPSGVTRLLEGLEAAGFVERAACPSDLRVTYARLTPAGARVLAGAARDHEEAIAALLEGSLSDDEIHDLAELLGRLPGVGLG
jgi:DNA-binding MarR family transcriptional regulator